jgi:type VI secretion system protein ImpI/type VI secretion system protein
VTLTLNILRCPDAVPPESRRVEGGEFSIGRGPGNDWILADPDRHLSKRHCVLAFRHGGWQLADTSTNGTFLNREATPVGAGAPRDLRSGDRLRLGAYEIEITLSEAEPESAFGNWAPSGRATTPPQGGSPFSDDPFADAPPPRRQSGFTPADNPFADNPFAEARPGSVRLPSDFDPLAPEPEEAAFGAAVQADHTPSLGDAFRPPQTSPGLLPDDWDLDEPAPPPPPKLTRQTAAWTEPVVAAEPPPPPLPPPEQRAREPAADTSLLAAFLEGAALDGAAPADPVAAMRALGAAFRATVGGLRAALIARAEIKGEFRIEQTMIRAKGNNPLKFSANDDDALAALLGTGRRVDMSPEAAIIDALRDIRLHELATMAAMQAAVRALLARLDPVKLHAAEEGGVGLPMQRRARAFGAFEKLHGEITRALSDDFDSVFGRAFARAYEQALAEAARKEPV